MRDMLGKQAKILAPRDVTDLLAFADCSRHPLRNRVIVMLSAKAGLRAGEIAALTWDMVVDAGGQIGNLIELRDHAAKKGSGRLIPMHPDLADALSVWRQVSTVSGHVVRSERGGPMTALSIVVWFKRACLDGCSSHSARPGSYTRPAARCATCSYWPVIAPFKQLSDISTATLTPSASSSR
jgi:integrase